MTTILRRKNNLSLQPNLERPPRTTETHSFSTRAPLLMTLGRKREKATLDFLSR
jgi:hypothetical protein